MHLRLDVFRHPAQVRALHHGCHFAQTAVRLRTDGIFRSLVYCPEYRTFIGKLELRLLRMHIDIDAALRYLYIQHGQRKATFRHHGLVGIIDGLGDGLVPYHATIHDICLPAAIAFQEARLRDEARYAQVFIIQLQLQQ